MKKKDVELWSQVLKQIKKKVSRQVYETWFKQTSQVSLIEGMLIVEAPSLLYKQLFEEKYADMIQEIVEDIVQKRTEISYRVAADGDVESPGPLFDLIGKTSESEPAVSPSSADTDSSEGILQNHYTFNRFVVGPSNQFAHAAAQAVAHNPSKSYNPLFIYGGVGLGKTHLMHAIGNQIRESDPRTQILYVQSEQFTNEVITHIRLDKMPLFRKKYRNADLLMIDDIQFIAGKDSTVNEFFHTFNTLYHAQKQIVITSDQPPRKISNLEERIRSRFEWGLIADIQPPNLETKVAILQKKAEELGISLTNEIAIFMASKVISNVRELEGSLLNLSARVSLTGANIDMDAAWEALRQYVSESQRIITIEMVQKQVSEFYDIKTSALRAKGRSQEVALPRQVAMYLCRKFTNRSLAEIGRKFGGAKSYDRNSCLQKNRR